MEAVVEFGNTPGGNDFNVWLEGIECEFETNLVVAFACAAVGDGNTVFPEGNGNLGTGDDGAGERSSWNGLLGFCESSMGV